MARRRIRSQPIEFQPFSVKQKQILTWLMPGSPHRDKNGIIVDGSIRSGKTFSMALSYGLWAMKNFNLKNFGMAGKTIGALRRNVINDLKRMMETEGFNVHDNRTDNIITISYGSGKNRKENYFYLFGGKDESSQDLIQGVTLAGMYFDEVALMPQSFVNQATGQLSVDGAKFWMNCNPESPFHFVKTEWIDKAIEKLALYLHFNMEDNLTLRLNRRKFYEPP